MTARKGKGLCSLYVVGGRADLELGMRSLISVPTGGWFDSVSCVRGSSGSGNKPVGFVGYGGVAAGTRSVQQLLQVGTTVKIAAVAIPFVRAIVGENGNVATTP